MAERLKNIPKQLLEIWNRYTKKQKTLVVSVVCVVVIAFTLLIFLINKVDYTQLKVAETASEASNIIDLIKEEGYKYRFDKDTLTIYIDNKSSADAVLLLAKNDITTDDMSLDDLLGNSLGTTNADRILKVNLYYQNKIRNKLVQMEGIENAEVYYIPRETSNNIFTDEREDVSASVLLTVNDDFKPETAETIAHVVASIIGNEDSKKIKVADQSGNLLYGGGDDLYTGTASNNEDYKERLRNNFKNNLYMLLIKSDFNDVEIATELKFNMDKVNEMYTEYTAPEGMEQGLYSYSKNYKAENSNSADGGVPGTSANDGTTYNILDPNSSSSSTESSEYEYLPNERIVNTEYEVGAILPDQSSLGIVLTRVETLKEEELERNGTLEGTTYVDYVAQNSDLKPIATEPSLLTLVSKSTGVPEENIAISAFEQWVFVPKTEITRSWTDYLQYALVVLIVLLLLFVVFMSLRPVEVTELEPELSVEQLLATTKENQTIEDIDFNEVSEVRKMIEKFVDEKPEAVAQLLRNWLNEDWN